MGTPGGGRPAPGITDTPMVGALRRTPFAVAKTKDGVERGGPGPSGHRPFPFPPPPGGARTCSATRAPHLLIRRRSTPAPSRGKIFRPPSGSDPTARRVRGALASAGRVGGDRGAPRDRKRADQFRKVRSNVGRLVIGMETGFSRGSRYC